MNDWNITTVKANQMRSGEFKIRIKVLDFPFGKEGYTYKNTKYNIYTAISSEDFFQESKESDGLPMLDIKKGSMFNIHLSENAIKNAWTCNFRKVNLSDHNKEVTFTLIRETRKSYSILNEEEN